METLYDKKELAAYLKVSPGTIDNFRRQDRLTSTQVGTVNGYLVKSTA